MPFGAIRPARAALVALPLLGAPALSLVLAPLPAFAADVLPATGLVDVLPLGEVVGDGQTETTVHAVVRLPSGAPVTGLKLKASTTSGTVSDVVEIGEGVYATRLVAATTTAPTVAIVSFKGKADALGALEARRELVVTPPFRGTVMVGASQPALVLGTDTDTTLSIAFPAGLEAPADAKDVLVRVSAGSIASVVALGGGRFSARYVAPSENFPRLAIVTVSDRRAPADVWGVGVVSLQGRVEYPVSARPGANVILKVGGREFGPVTADDSGRASVPIVVPPGVGVATQITADASGLTETTLDLRVPGARRLSFFSAPPSLPADSRVTVPVRVVVRKADGTPDVDTVPTFTATAGRVSEARHAGDGVYVATFTPPDGRAALTATVQATLGADTTQADALELSLVPGLPAAVKLVAEPQVLSPGTTALKVYATLEAADGSGLPGRTVRFAAAGATFKGVTDLKGGDYRADFSANPGTDAFIEAAAVSSASSNALRHIVLLPGAPAARPGTRQLVTVVATDAYGYAVPNVAVDLTVSGPGGQIPARVVTDAQGVADVIYDAGVNPGLVHVEAKAGAARGATSFWQAEIQATSFPTSGSVAQRTVEQMWRSAVVRVSVDREGGIDAPLVEIATPGPEAAAAVEAPPVVETTGPTLAAVPAAAQIPPGGSIDLLVRVATATGTGVDGATLEAFATGGARVSAFAPLGAGNYKAVVTAPADATGAIKINVRAVGSSGETFVEIPVGGTPVAAAPVQVPKKVSERPDDRPWARLRVGFLVGSYQFEQTPGENPDTLLPQAIGWGGERGGAPTPLGLDTGFRGFLPMAKWVGLDASFRWSRYEVSSDRFSEAAVDNLFAIRASAVGRVPVAIGSSELSFGVRAGFRWDDLVTFRGDVTPGSTVTYEPLGLPGLDTGLEIGAEFWKMYVLASGSAGFANGSVPYAGNADFHVGYNFVKWAFVDLGFGYQYRNIQAIGATSGEVRATLQDQLLFGSASVGVSF